MRDRTRDLEHALELYEKAVREHAFAHAVVTTKLRRGETPTREELADVDRAVGALDSRRAALRLHVFRRPP
jgi:hypothetical protein